MLWRFVCGLLGALYGAALFWPSTSRAEPQWIIGYPSDEVRMTDLSFGTALDGGWGFGLTPGVQLSIPVLDSGFIRSINDSFHLEPGLFLSARFNRRGESFVWVVPEFGPRWNFHLTPNWDAFAQIKVGWAIGKHHDFWLRAGPGMQWWFKRPWGLRLEAWGGPRTHGGGYLGLSYQFL
jgi:hypothetical protein